MPWPAEVSWPSLIINSLVAAPYGSFLFPAAGGLIGSLGSLLFVRWLDRTEKVSTPPRALATIVAGTALLFAILGWVLYFGIDT